jgi:hypothetical protein
VAPALPALPAGALAGLSFSQIGGKSGMAHLDGWNHCVAIIPS